MLIRAHRDSYTSGNRLEKQQLGVNLLGQIHAKGGRFLKQVDSTNAVNAYYEVPEQVALAKVKQVRQDGEGVRFTLR